MKDNPHDIALRPMTEEDMEAVLAIECVSFPRPWTKINFLDELTSEYSFPLIAVDDGGAVIGYVIPMLIIDEGHILNVAVDRNFRGKGVGCLLMERVLGEFRERGARFVSLEVRVSNVTAISLYRRMGFIETGIRKRYYENSEDAILMEYTFAEDGVDDAI